MNEYEKQFQSLTLEQQRLLLMLEFSKLKKITEIIPPKLIRVYHDGKCKTYNNPEQMQQNLSDIPSELLKLDTFTFVKITDVMADFNKMLEQLKSLGFTGIKNYMLFFDSSNDFKMTILREV